MSCRTNRIPGRRHGGMSRRAVLLGGMSVGLLGAARGAGAAETVGAVERLRGTAAAKAYATQSLRGLAVNAGVLFRDTLLTGAESRLQVRFNDDSVLQIGDASQLVIDKFLYDPNGESGGALRLIRGAFRMVTGAITKVNGSSGLQVATPLANIGVRGTDFWGDQGADRLAVGLLSEGLVVISSPGGTVTLSQPLTWTEITAPGATPTPPRPMSPQKLQQAAGSVAP